MLNLWQLIFLFIIFLIVYIYMFGWIRNYILEEHNAIMKLNIHPLFEFSFPRNRGIDCALNRLPCITDDQCRDNCVIASAASELTCEQGFCNAADALVNAQSPDLIECDPALGLMHVFAVGGDFVVSQTCVSTYRDLIDDSGSPRPYLCDNGTLSLNLHATQFSAQSCECLPNYEKMIFRQTALARTIPVCIPVEVANIYRRIYT
jgi:Per os infectivity factor 3